MRGRSPSFLRCDTWIIGSQSQIALVIAATHRHYPERYGELPVRKGAGFEMMTGRRPVCLMYWYSAVLDKAYITPVQLPIARYVKYDKPNEDIQYSIS